MPHPQSTLLFRISSELVKSTGPYTAKRPVFFWFNDSYHSHIPSSSPAFKYLYIYLVRPTDNAKLFTRHGTGGFESLWQDYTDYLKNRTSTGYHEPGVVFSFSNLTPVVIGELDDGFNVEALRTDTNKRASFWLGEPGSFRRFNEIPELNALLPEIQNAVPLSMPSKNIDAFWPADSENEGRMWL